MKTALLAITESGLTSAELLSSRLEDSVFFDLRGKGRLREWVSSEFHNYEGIIFFAALGIVYRVIADVIRNKYEDPAIVAVDDASRYAVSALSGHEGGANNLAFKVAALIDAEPVISTASDTNRTLIIGIGCRKGVPAEKITSAVINTFEEFNLSPGDVRLAASAWIKRNERGLIDAFRRLSIPLVFIEESRIKMFRGGDSDSGAARRHLGIPGVSEPCALLAGKNAELIVPRQKKGPVTVAVGRENINIWKDR